MNKEDIRNELTGKGLRVTPQRVAILEAIIELKNHPTADYVIEFIKEHHPNIATGTVYKILEALVENGLIKKVKTDKDVMRYDAILEPHHHLYSAESNRIEDYFDEELNTLVSDYFKKKKIPGFEIKDIKLQIIGNFKKTKLK
jgi:Fur family peroxide stress response transcriptional regulator